MTSLVFKRTRLIEDLSRVGVRVEDDKESGSKEYDIVIVGGGTAGCVLASRLSEDPSINVLLIESGKSSKNVLLSRIPAAFTFLFEKKKHMFNFYTTAQPNVANQKLYWPRGRALGGCSAINAQMFHYGDPTDYDEWAQLGGPGAESWAYKDFHSYFTKFEKFTPSKAHPDVDTSLHGSSGPVNVGFFGHHSTITKKFIEACENLGIPRIPDLNTAKGSKGVAKLMTYIDSKGRRVTTENAYLTSEVLARPNLSVAIGATVTKLLFDKGEDSGEPRVSGVEFTARAGGQRYKVRAKKEVVLSAGAIHTPHIMMLSGLGPSVELARHGIDTVVDLPGVGEHLMDHIVTDTAMKETSGQSLIILKPRNAREAARSLPHLARYLLKGTGGLTCNFGEAAAFVRADDKTLFPDGEAPEDATSGSEAPDLELFVTPMGYGKHGLADMPVEDSLGLHITLLRPTSTGKISLNSNDPFDAPIIDPNYLATAHDRAVLLRGVRLILRIAAQSPLADIIDNSPSKPDKRWGHTLASASDEELEVYISRNTETLYHPTCTARMAPRDAGGVVDPRLRVYGVKGLRIVDASVFPTIISGHTAAPTIAVAEKAADMIKEDIGAGKTAKM